MLSVAGKARFILFKHNIITLSNTNFSYWYNKNIDSILIKCFNIYFVGLVKLLKVDSSLSLSSNRILDMCLTVELRVANSLGIASMPTNCCCTQHLSKRNTKVYILEWFNIISLSFYGFEKDFFFFC